MYITHLEFIRDNSIKGITYPLFNSNKQTYIVYFNSDLEYNDIDTLINFARDHRRYYDHRLFCMARSDWNNLLDALRGGV